jgi:hypothetical protein
MGFRFQLSFIFISLWSLRICSGPCNIKSLRNSGCAEGLKIEKPGMEPYSCRMSETMNFLAGKLYITTQSTEILRIRGGDGSSEVKKKKKIPTGKVIKSKSKDSVKEKHSESLAEDKAISKSSKLAKIKSPKKKSKRKSGVDWDTWRKVPKGKSRHGTDVVAGTGPRLYQVPLCFLHHQRRGVHLRPPASQPHNTTPIERLRGSRTPPAVPPPPPIRPPDAGRCRDTPPYPRALMGRRARLWRRSSGGWAAGRCTARRCGRTSRTCPIATWRARCGGRGVGVEED